MKLICALAALCGSSTVAVAGTPTPGFTLETRWVALSTPSQINPRGTQLASGTVVDTNAAQAFVESDYRQRFELQARIVNVIGQNNLGVFSLSGDIAASSAGVSNNVLINKAATNTAGLGRAGGYSLGPGETEQYLDEGYASLADRVDSIVHFEASGPFNKVTPWTYNFDTNQPNPFPNNPGPYAGIGENWASIYRIMVDIRPGDVSPGGGSVTVDFSFNHGYGYSSPTGLRGWDLYLQAGQQFPEPNEFNPTTDVLWYALPMFGSHGEGNHSDIEIPASFRLNVIPAPATAGLLGVAGLTTYRRRRS